MNRATQGTIGTCENSKGNEVLYQLKDLFIPFSGIYLILERIKNAEVGAKHYLQEDI